MDGSYSAFPTAVAPLRTANHTALDRLEAQITELWGHLNAATYRFLLLVAEFDRSEALRASRPREHGAVAQLAMRHRHGRGAREGPRRARARVAARDQRRVRERRVLVFEGARDDARRDARERSPCS